MNPSVPGIIKSDVQNLCGIPSAASKEKILKLNEDKEEVEDSMLTAEEVSAEVCHLLGNVSYCKTIQMALKMEGQDQILKKSQADIASLPTRKYLDHTIIPILMSGLCYLAKERPADPISALAVFLLKNRSDYQSDDVKSDNLQNK